mgnify:CR=1 FL=1
MQKEVLVSDLMTHNPATIKPDTNLLECAKIMVRKDIGSLVITDKEKTLLGFISRRDILWALVKKSKEYLQKIKAMDISPKKIATIKPEATLREAIKKIKELKFERLPVVKKGRLVGIITVRDILSFHPEIYTELEEFAKIKEESEKLRRIKGKEISREEGNCERCGNQNILQKFNGMLLCNSCMNVL